MSKFRFRLATLLRLREAARDQRRSELAEAHRVDEVLHARAEGVRRELEWLKDRCRRAAGPGTVNVDQLVEGQRYELTLKAQGTQIQRQREMVVQEIQRRREALLAADRDVRVMEKLREKQAQQHREEEERQEHKRLDEVASLRAASKEAC